VVTTYHQELVSRAIDAAGAAWVSGDADAIFAANDEVDSAIEEAYADASASNDPASWAWLAGLMEPKGVTSAILAVSNQLKARAKMSKKVRILPTVVEDEAAEDAVWVAKAIAIAAMDAAKDASDAYLLFINEVDVGAAALRKTYKTCDKLWPPTTKELQESIECYTKVANWEAANRLLAKTLPEGIRSIIAKEAEDAYCYLAIYHVETQRRWAADPSSHP